MRLKAVSGIMLTLLFIGMLTLAFNTQPVKSDWICTEIIYIRADGSVDPDTASISSVDNITYTLTDNIVVATLIDNAIVVERDNIVVDGAGYTLQGTGGETGIYLTGKSNVTIKNMEIRSFWVACMVDGSSNNNIISGNNIALSLYGILFDSSLNNTISGNNITNNQAGIRLDSSSNNSIFGNNITQNSWCGIVLFKSSINKIYHNKFIDNTNQTFVQEAYANIWDDGYPSGGNYWSNYTGVDVKSGLFQNETGSDGIGDTSYPIDEDNQDNYPLMGMFSDFKATSEYHIQTICNSSISEFQYNETAICFNVTGENDTTGFCRICIPRALMNETYRVFVNGTEVPCNLLPCSNSTHSYLYFTYDLSTQEVIVIPEFPSFLILPLFMTATLLAVIVCRRKQL